MRVYLALLAVLALAGCGGPQDGSSTPDESGDLAVRSGRGGRNGGGAPGTIPPGLDGTTWRWVEAYCTEGPLDLLARGYASTIQIRQDSTGLTLITDQIFATELCQQTVLVSARPGRPDWQIEETTRIAVPPTEECFATPEPVHPGEIRVVDGRLEVLVQYSQQWCNGLEARMVYERAPDGLLTEDQIVRRYAAFFSRGDATALAGLFAQGGTLLERFTRTETGAPYQHIGRERIGSYFADTFQSAPWRAMRITEIIEGTSTSGSPQRIVTWEYMDPRLQEPFAGVTRFTIAAGEIFEADIMLTTDPTLVPTPEGEEDGATAQAAH